MMRTRLHCKVGALILLLSVLCTGARAAEIALQEQMLDHPSFGLAEIMVPEGYRLEILPAELDHPRMIEFAPNGDMFIGSGRHVYKLTPPYAESTVFLSLQTYPHSVAIRGEEMFVATTPQLLRLPYIPDQRAANSVALRVVTPLPGGPGHSSRTVKVGPDDALYVSVGIAGNCSDQLISDDYPFRHRRGGIFRVAESGSTAHLEPFASGLRNPVDFDWHPTSELMYAANNGPDHHGFEQPPEYFSELEEGSFHGMPWFQFDGERIAPDDCISSDPPLPMDEVKLPVATFPARNAPLGVTFVPQGAMDERFELSAAVALHGSWGTQPDGDFVGPPASRRPPAVVLVRFEDERAVGVEPIITGFQDESGMRWARPAGVAVGPDGLLYITSDGGLFEGLMRLVPSGQ